MQRSLPKLQMCASLKISIFFALLLIFLQSSVFAQEEVIWTQAYGGNGVRDYGPSQKSMGEGFNYNAEYADDFDLTGTINRIDFLGYANGPTPPSASSAHYHGINVRFYAVGSDNKPGALQTEYFIPKNSPDILFHSTGLGDLRVRLATPFQAIGRHFVSVQLVMDPIFVPGGGGTLANWYWRSGFAETIRGEAPYNRSDLNSPWDRTNGNDGQRNLSLRLWGTRTLNSPPVLSQLSKTTIEQAGRLKISGVNFGNSQGESVVRINGAAAPISKWSETSITAYVTDTATLGEGTVQVTSAGGASNTLAITVTQRPAAQGRVRWRFQADAGTIYGRPATGPDGTVYTVDQSGNLYALTTTGGLKWIVNGGNLAMQGPSVGVDGTVHFAAGNKLFAINPDGTQKWRIDHASGGIIGGPNVGTDGNVYAVFDNGQATGSSAVVVDAEGKIIDNDAGYSGSTFATREIVFGAPGQYYFSLNNVDPQRSGLNFFGLGGGFLFSKPQLRGPAATAPDGTLYATESSSSQLVAINPADGSVIRTLGNMRSPDVDTDGNVYAVGGAKVFSFDAAGEERWQFQSFGFPGDPVVSPNNDYAVIDTYKIGAAGVIQAIASDEGQLKWQVDLQPENNGYIRAFSRQRFSADSSTVYFGMNVNDYASDVYTYLYAINSSEMPCIYVVAPENVDHPYNGGAGNVGVTPTNVDCEWTAESNVNWIIVHDEAGTGNKKVNYSVLANPNQTPRTGTMTIAGNTVTITQEPKPNDTSVEITYPASGQEFTLPSSIFIAANAIAPGRSITRVDFYINDVNRLGLDFKAPYQVVWNDVYPGEYTFTARAFDDQGIEILSQPVTVTVNPFPGPGSQPDPIPDPELLSPENGQVFQAGQTILFQARPRPWFTATERVEFYLGTTLVGEDDTAPYTYELKNAPAGPQTISARTIDVNGAMANCRPIDIIVNSQKEFAQNTNFDFDGDGRADISVYRAGVWYLNQSTAGFGAMHFGIATDDLAPADYDGDGKTDVAVFRSGAWYILGSESGVSGLTFGQAGDIPQPGDYDGDGKADPAIFRPNGGLWYAALSGGGFMAHQFGAANDKPVAEDYDGDGRKDPGVYRDGIWYALKSTGGVMTMQFGIAGDKAVPADYDGDGKADIAVYRNGIWYISGSTDGVKIYNFGTGEDSAAPADYDGDGKADIAVFRPSTGAWYVMRSQAGLMVTAFGMAGDAAVPSAYVR